eukprot:TRINITY_DN29706_c0_g1_i1.p3 TRINITY_DN29706_c0_g1~~TRINITY_DN29706_c0_g1_i1.p3  ORF type:complete len:133 (-),score=1.32 TRINITY_DN29706_c0_g1_i1:60-458(-)
MEHQLFKKPKGYHTSIALLKFEQTSITSKISQKKKQKNNNDNPNYFTFPFQNPTHKKPAPTVSLLTTQDFFNLSNLARKASISSRLLFQSSSGYVQGIQVGAEGKSAGFVGGKTVVVGGAGASNGIPATTSF